ncbi:MAG: tetratricopeptide repeat protein [Betaproteobacteria bacterium]|nr:tetratricopeptide repeat protein [Betaproteobacteria bacterium]
MSMEDIDEPKEPSPTTMTVTDQEASGKQPEIPQLGADSPEPASPQKGGNAFVIFALFVLIAGIVGAIVYATRSDPPVAEEAPQASEIAQPEHGAAPLAHKAAPHPSTKPAKKTETKPETDSEKQQIRKLTHTEFDKLKSLESDAFSSHEIAGEYYRHGDYANALVWYQKARNGFEQVLPYYRKSLGDEHNNTITIRKNLAAVYNAIGEVYRNQKKYTESLNWLNKSLEIREKILGKDHPETAQTYNNIALVYDAKGHYAKALEWYQKDLAISEKTLGSNHPDTAKTYNNIGMVYFHQGDHTNALEWFKKASAIQEKGQPDSDPNAAMTYNNIAEVYRLQGDYVLALPKYLKAYRILLNTFGEKNSTTRAVKINLARAYDKSGNTTPFDEWFEESLR